ncbi:hypothetical protein BO94DRAFT_562395 [Aspergillus sclerotioniger CBS 115572]|uniref:Nuclear GTPase SLIP-GC n=1 Tax=Aspergillus sclerotioniger CBS 115572 TaxID=1450535 RepID=A0A317XDU0_9EURO|nr:hypothetical protein BO94DRAFT_562395 [Aspergillus sclerotioniger CBS 115572]PWY95777.1 hypothetical protein BO94DRAFT_562395 [Aspergillus sclerotioniger CBS 115572]
MEENLILRPRSHSRDPDLDVSHLAELHYVAEQTARHVRSWEGQEDAPPCPDFKGSWSSVTPKLRDVYIERVKYLSRVHGQAQKDYEGFVKSLYERCYGGMDQLAAETISCVGFAEFKVLIDGFGSGFAVFSDQNVLSDMQGGGDDVVTESMVVDQGESEPVADPSNEDVPMTDPVEEPPAEYDIADTENPGITALENAVTKGTIVLKKLYAVLDESVAWGAERDWKAEIVRTLEYAGTEKVIIGVVGCTGAGKSSLINAILDEKNVLSTDCMRASTAVATEISYNDGKSKYRAEVEFIKQKEWERELEILFAEIRDHQEEVARGAIPKDSDAAVALDKIKSVYPTMTPQDILNASVADLLGNERVSELLGTTLGFEGNDSKAFSAKLKFYIDSKGKRGRPKKSAKKEEDAAGQADSTSKSDTSDHGIGLWPLVRVVRIYTRASALATGAVLVDLPGIFDSNAARVAVAEEYMRRCSAHWIVAPINRAVDDKVARDLLGKNYKLQMQMECAFNDITFICTKTDDIAPVEVIQSLGLDLPSMNELQELPARAKPLEDGIEELKEAKKKVSRQLEWLEEESEELEERLTGNEFGCDLSEITPKRKKPHNSAQLPAGETENDTLATPTVQDTDGTELPEVERLKDKFYELRSRRKELQSQRKHINQQVENKAKELRQLEEEKKEMEHGILRSCIEARNKFSKTQIKRDFALEVQSMDQEAEDDDTEAQARAPSQDYEELEKNLPVFCVSTRAYQGLRGRPDMVKVVGGFSQLEETEIPLLQRHCLKLTEKAREGSSRRFLTQLNQLLQSMLLWSSVSSASGKASEQKVKELEADFENVVEVLAEAMKTIENQSKSAIREIFQDNILNKLGRASRSAISGFPEAVSHWNAPGGAGGFRYNTYKAICRRRGVFHGLMQDWNRDLARPMLEKIGPGWKKTFAELLPQVNISLIKELEAALVRFHLQAIDSTKQSVARETRQRLQSTFEASHQVMREQISLVEKFIAQERKRILGVFAEAISQELEQTYQACASETGIGSLTRIRTLMQQVADSRATAVFRGSTEHVRRELEVLLDEYEAQVDRIIQSRLRRISRDYHGALIAPQIRMCTKEQVRITREVASIIDNTEAELRLQELL